MYKKVHGRKLHFDHLVHFFSRRRFKLESTRMSQVIVEGGKVEL